MNKTHPKYTNSTMDDSACYQHAVQIYCLGGTYSAIPAPKCTIIFHVLFFNNLEHTTHAFTGLDYSFYLPSNLNIGHITADASAEEH